MYIETPLPTLFLSLSLNTCEYPKKLCVDTLYSQSHVSVKDKIEKLLCNPARKCLTASMFFGRLLTFRFNIEN